MNAEHALLGCLLDDAEPLFRVPLTPEHFTDPHLRQAFRVVRQLAEAGERVDTLTTWEALKAAGSLLPSSWVAEVLLAGRETIFSAVWPIVAEAHRRRELERIAQAIVRVAKDPTGEIATVVPEALDRLAQVLADQPDVRLIDAQTAAEAERVALDAPVLPGIPTGFPDLDGLVSGLPRGELTVLASRPGMGKSALAQQIAAFNAAAGRHVVLCSPEMSASQVAQRLLAQLSGVNLHAFRTRHLTTFDRVKLQGTAVPSFTICDRSPMTTLDIASVARRCQARQPVDLLVVDHLQFLADAALAGESRTAQVGRMVRSLVGLARALDCAVVLLSQLNRQVEQRSDKRPGLADLRESGDIEQDAYLVLLLYRAAYYDRTANATAEVAVAKHRNGPLGTETLTWDAASARFQPYASEQAA